MFKAKILVYGADNRLMLPVVVSLTRIVLHGVFRPIRGKKEFEIIPVMRDKPFEIPEPSERALDMVMGWINTTVCEKFGYKNPDEMIHVLRRTKYPIPNFSSDMQKVDADVVIFTDTATISNFLEYPLFLDPVYCHKILNSVAYAELVTGIANDLLILFTERREAIIKAVTKRNEAESKVVNLPVGVRIEKMGTILDSMDLNYAPDFAVFDQVITTATRDLFNEKPADEWHAWLLGCLVTGMQARIAEAGTMWQVYLENQRRTVEGEDEG